MNENKSNEEKWREESKAEGSKYFGSERWNLSGEFNFRDNFINGYLAGRKAGQEEIDMLLSDYIRINDELIHLNDKFEKLKAENERLKEDYMELCSVSIDQENFERELKKENERLKSIERLYHDLFHEWNEDCENECDKYGHAEDCGRVDLGSAKRNMRIQIDELCLKNSEIEINIEKLKDLVSRAKPWIIERKYARALDKKDYDEELQWQKGAEEILK